MNCDYLREFSKKFETVLILWGWGEADSSKKPDAKNLDTLIGIYIDWPDPHGHALDANTDPDPAKMCGSDLIQIHKTGNIR